MYIIPFIGIIHPVVSLFPLCGEARSRERFACLFVRIIRCLSVGVLVYVLVRLSVCLLAYLLVHSFNYVRRFVCSACFVCLFVCSSAYSSVYLFVMLVSFGKVFVVRAPDRRAL